MLYVHVHHLEKTKYYSYTQDISVVIRPEKSEKLSNVLVSKKKCFGLSKYYYIATLYILLSLYMHVLLT